MSKTRRSSSKTPQDHSKIFAFIFLVLLVLLAIGFFFFYTGERGKVSNFGDKDATHQGIAIRHRHDTRRVTLDAKITEQLRNFISWRKSDIGLVEIVVNDIPKDNRVTPETRSLVFSLDVHFKSGAIIRTRPRTVSGAELKERIVKDIKKAQEQHARYLKDGTVKPGQSGRIFNI